MSLQTKIKGIYDLIHERGLYIAPEQNIKFGKKQSYDLNMNGSETATYGEESYNAVLLLSLFSGIRRRGTQIFFGPPGAGKTTLAELAGHFIYGKTIEEIQNATIYGHPEHTESSMIARLHTGKLIQGLEEVLPREFVKSKVKIIDEVNRLPPGKLSILYQLVDRGYVNFLSERIVAEEGPVYATANAPDSGNYQLPIPFLDRFDVALVTNELNPLFIDVLIEKGDGNAKNNYQERLKTPTNLVITKEEIEKGRTEIEKINIDSDAFYFLINFISAINYCNKAGVDLEHKTKAFALTKKPGEGLCSNCHYKGNICSLTSNDLSARTYSAIIAYSKTMAWFRGKNQLNIDDLEAIIPYATWHKLHPTRFAYDLNESFENDRIALIKNIIENTKKEYTSFKKIFKNYERVIEELQTILPAKDKSKIVLLEKEIKNIIEDLKKIDSVSKYPLATFFSQILTQVKC